MPLSKLYNIQEMAAPRKQASWAVLDWAAQQSGPFTINDMWKIWQENGGGGTIQNFHTTIGHMTAKPWKDDQGKYALSRSRPFQLDKRGRQGKGGAHVYSWGLNAPLREPQAAQEPLAPEDSPIGDVLDKLEAKMGRGPLKVAMQRWKKMKSVGQVANDIANIKDEHGRPLSAKYQMMAIQAATEHLVQSGQADEDEVEDAEQEVSQAPAPKATPFASKPAAPKAPVAAPAPQASDDDDEDMGDGWSTIPNEDEPEVAAEPEADDDDEDMGDGWSTVSNDGEEPEAEEQPEVDNREYPAYLPDPDDEGDKYERAMFQIVSETDPVIDEFDPVWEKLKAAKNDIDAHRIIKMSSIPKNLHSAAIRVAHQIFVNTGRDPETGASIKRAGNESKLARLYRR